MMCDLPKNHDVNEIDKMIKDWLSEDSKKDIIDNKEGVGIMQIFETTSLESIKSEKLKILNSLSKMKLEQIDADKNDNSVSEELLKTNVTAIKNSEDSIKKLNENMDRIIKNYDGDSTKYKEDDKYKMGQFTGKAIITFNNQKTAQDMIDKNPKSNLRQTISRFFGCSDDKPVHTECCHKFYVHCKRPNEPSDILWENLH